MKLNCDYNLTSVDFDKPNKFALTKRKMKDMRITLEKKMRRGQHIVKPLHIVIRAQGLLVVYADWGARVLCFSLPFLRVISLLFSLFVHTFNYL